MYAVADGTGAHHGGVLFRYADLRLRRTPNFRTLDAVRPERKDVPVTQSPASRRRADADDVAGPEEELLRQLYEQHAGALLMFVSRLTGGDRQRAEDIVQETLLRAWRNAHRLGTGGETSLRPWLVTVARRIAIDDYRSDRARPTELYDRDLENFSTDDETDRVLRTMTVTDALRALTPSHREILVRTYFQGRTVAEAADELGLPLGTAKSRLYYAMRALRASLEQRGVTG
jgi:RNA polymerase sigma-70 factor (ECF subfamily)